MKSKEILINKISNPRMTITTTKMVEDMAPTELLMVLLEELAEEQVEGAAVGYGNHIVLHDLNLRIDQDDRIALLGQNGEGKSTLSKLLVGKLDPMGGRVTRARKLRIGYFGFDGEAAVPIGSWQVLQSQGSVSGSVISTWPALMLAAS